MPSPFRRATRPLAAAVGSLGALTLLLGGACAPLTNRLLLFPSRTDLDLHGAYRVMLADERGAIETIRAKSPAAQHVAAASIVLRFYGNADRADGWVAGEAASFGDWPVEVWGVNYPGFGRSEGSASLEGVARAADVALADAEKRGLPIYVMGTSMGTTASLHLAAKGAVRGVFLHNPPPLAQLIRGRHGWWNLWLLAAPISWAVPAAVDSLENARRAKMPLVMLTSGRDELVPTSYQDDIFEAYAGPKVRVVASDIGHNDPVPDSVWRDVHDKLGQQGWRR